MPPCGNKVFTVSQRPGDTTASHSLCLLLCWTLADPDLVLEVTGCAADTSIPGLSTSWSQATQVSSQTGMQLCPNAMCKPTRCASSSLSECIGKVDTEQGCMQVMCQAIQDTYHTLVILMQAGR